MKITSLNIPDVLLIEPRVLEDSRGFFFESFRGDIFKKETSLDISFVQDNHTKSSQGVLRVFIINYLPMPKENWCVWFKAKC